MIAKTFVLLILFLAVVNGSTLVTAQTRNLLKNPDAADGPLSWRAFGDTAIETTPGNGPHFVVRNGGYFLQDVPVPLGPAGRYVVFVGRGATERINSNGAITGLPYLYGYMMRPPGLGQKEILAYLEGQGMRAHPNITGQWVNMWGVFEVPEGTTSVRFFLNQASAAGTPHNGSATRFANLGLYLFANKEDAEDFVSRYQY